MNKGFTLIEIFLILLGLFKALEFIFILFNFSNLNIFITIILSVILFVTLPFCFFYLFVQTYNNEKKIFNLFFSFLKIVICISIFFFLPYFIFINYFILILNFVVGLVSITIVIVMAIAELNNKLFIKKN